MRGIQPLLQRSADFAAWDISTGFVVCLLLSFGVFAFWAVPGVLAGAKELALGELVAIGAAPGSSPTDGASLAACSLGCHALRRGSIIHHRIDAAASATPFSA